MFLDMNRIQDYTRALELGPEDESSEEVAQLLREAKLALKKSKRIDYYALLEVAVDASPVDIKKGFRRACLKWHPDKVSYLCCSMLLASIPICSSLSTIRAHGNVLQALPEAREENERMFKMVNEGNGEKPQLCQVPPPAVELAF